MHDVALVRVCKSVGDLTKNFPDFARLHDAFLLKPGGEVIAGDERHDEEHEIIAL
jgi:hypothetical protein